MITPKHMQQCAALNEGCSSNMLMKAAVLDEVFSEEKHGR